MVGGVAFALKKSELELSPSIQLVTSLIRTSR